MFSELDSYSVTLSNQMAEVNDILEANGSAAALARLTPRHLADLRASGLSDQQIAACGFHSLQAIESIQSVLRWKRYNGDLGSFSTVRRAGGL